MKKLIVAVVLIASLAALAYAVVRSLAVSEEKQSKAALGRIESDASFASRYPDIARTDASAERLQLLAAPLEIGLQPVRPEVVASRHFNADLGASLSGWLDQQRMSADDTITTPPPDVERWLAARDGEIRAIAQHLRTSPAPHWPQTAVRSPDSPLPNLLGHMRLLRTLTAAALRAELAGDHAHAWELEEASWRLSRALYERPELISRLIAIAGVRLIAASARKLEPASPAWFAEVDSLPLRRGMFDSARYELSGGWNVDQASASWKERMLMPIGRPVVQWISADLLGATTAELSRLTSSDPCELDIAHAQQRIRTNLSPLARKLDFASLNLIDAYARAADTEVAIDGTMRVLQVKSALAAGRPIALPADSPCRTGRWVFGTDGVGVRTLRFTGKVSPPTRALAAPIPTTYSVRG